jgi:hypothetical protein
LIFTLHDQHVGIIDPCRHDIDHDVAWPRVGCGELAMMKVFNRRERLADHGFHITLLSHAIRRAAVD